MATAAKKGLYQPSEIKPNEFVYSAPRPNPTGTITNVYMNYNKTRPKIQSPIMFCPFGISVMVDEKKKDAEPGFSVDLQLGNDNPKLAEFSAWLDTLDSQTLTDCKKNAGQWLKTCGLKGGVLSERMAKELFKPIVKKYYDKKKLAFTGEYADRVKFKLQRKNGKFVTRFFDHSRQPIDMNNFTIEEIKSYGKQFRCRIIFELGGIWAGAKGFGLTLKADQIMFYPPQKLTGFGFVDDVEDELIFGSLAVAAPVAQVAAPAPAPLAPNSDEEEVDQAATASPAVVDVEPEVEAEVEPQEEVEEPIVDNNEEENNEEQEEEEEEEVVVPVAKGKKGAVAPTPAAEPAKQAGISKYARAKKATTAAKK